MKYAKLHLAVGIGAAMLATTGFASDNLWPRGFPTLVKTKAEAESCCLPKEKVALACKDCKTVNEKGGEDKKGILAWFKPDSTHGCSGCGGRITVKHLEGKGGPLGSQYMHVCSKCGRDSAYTCATHKKS